MIFTSLENNIEKTGSKKGSLKPKTENSSRIERYPAKKEKEEALKSLSRTISHGQSIGKLATSYYYTFYHAMIKDLAHALNKHPEVHTLAVVDKDLKPMGIIIREDFFDTLAKPYGKEVFENKLAGRLLVEVPVFEEKMNIISVMNELEKKIERHKTQYFLLKDRENRFSGIFSNLDLLFYLSEMTQSDIKLAKSLQESIVKQKLNLFKQNFNFFAVSRMAKGVGGDFYTALEYFPDHWVFSLCDVSGKGIAASLVTSILGGVFFMYDFKDGLAHFIKKLNQYIFQSFNTEKYLTGVFIKFDSQTGKLHLIDMGHSYLYLYRDSRFFKMKSEARNFPVGIMPEIEPESSHFDLLPGDILIACTDGILEQTNEAGEEYGIERLSHVVKKYSRRDLENIGSALFDNIQFFKGKDPLKDDMTMMILQYKSSKPKIH